MTARSSRRTKGASQVRGRIFFCAPGRNGVAEYLTAYLPQPPGSLDHSTLLNLPERVQQLRRINFGNRS